MISFYLQTATQEGSQQFVNLTALVKYYLNSYQQSGRIGRIPTSSMATREQQGLVVSPQQLLAIVEAAIQAAMPFINIPAESWTPEMARLVQLACLLLLTFGYNATPRPGQLLSHVHSSSLIKCLGQKPKKTGDMPPCSDTSCPGNTLSPKEDGSVVMSTTHHKNYHR